MRQRNAATAWNAKRRETIKQTTRRERRPKPETYNVQAHQVFLDDCDQSASISELAIYHSFHRSSSLFHPTSDKHSRRTPQALSLLSYAMGKKNARSIKVGDFIHLPQRVYMLNHVRCHLRHVQKAACLSFRHQPLLHLPRRYTFFRTTCWNGSRAKSSRIASSNRWLRLIRLRKRFSRVCKSILWHDVTLRKASHATKLFGQKATSLRALVA